MQTHRNGFFAVVAVVLAAGLLVTNYAFTQDPPPARASNGFAPAQQFGGPVPMMSGNFQVVNDPTIIYIVRPDRIIRFDKTTMKIAGEVMLPSMPPRPGGPGGGFGGPGPAGGG